MTTSASATASAALSNTLAPLAAAAVAAAGTGSNPRTVWPAVIRFTDIGPPMLPSPRKAILKSSDIGAPLLRGRAEPRGLGTADDHPHDLVGTFQNSMHPQVSDDLLQTILAQVAVAAVQLQCLVCDVEARIGNVAFGHRTQLDFVGVVGVQCTRGSPQQHSRRLESGGHVRQGESDGGLVEQGRAEGLPFANVAAGFVEGGLGAAK